MRRILLSLGVVFGTVAAAAQQPTKLTVYVLAQSSNQDAAAIARSFIERELRSIGDVQVVQHERDAMFTFSVTGGKPLLVAGEPTGYGFALAVTENDPACRARDLRNVELLFGVTDDELRSSVQHAIANVDAASFSKRRARE